MVDNPPTISYTKSMKKFKVPVLYQGAISYIVEAENKEQANQKAVEIFNKYHPKMDSIEWQKVINTGIIEEVK